LLSSSSLVRDERPTGEGDRHDQDGGELISDAEVAEICYTAFAGTKRGWVGGERTGAGQLVNRPTTGGG
jgi:hypothetical protein